MVIFSPNRNTNDYPKGRESLTFEEKVESFRDSYKLWLLDIALSLATSNPNSGFAVLAILNPYFEIIGRHISGSTSEESKGRAKINTINGIDRVFPTIKENSLQIDNLSESLYNELRNPVAHLGLTGANVVLNGTYNSALTVHVKQSGEPIFVINPTLWALHLYQDFYKYIHELLDANNLELRSNFDKCYTSGVK